MISCTEASRRTPAVDAANLEVVRAWASGTAPSPEALHTGDMGIDTLKGLLLYRGVAIAELSERLQQAGYRYGVVIYAEQHLPTERHKYWAEVARFEAQSKASA